MNEQSIPNYSVLREFRNLAPIRYWIVHKLVHLPDFILPKSIGPFYSQDVAQKECDKMNGVV